MLASGSKLVAAFRFPHDSAEKAIAYLAQNGWAIQWGSFCELASAIPLGIFAVTAVSRLRFLGVRAAGESIAFLGGVGVTVMLILSALASWSLTRPGIAETTGAVPALQAISFAGGGPGFSVLLGLFIAGVSVTAGLHKLMPRWLMGLGIVVAIACELASLSLLNFKAAYFIPVGRFVSIVWMIGVSLKLPATITSSIAETETNRAQ
ncbi:MAG: hypothetical protein JWQ49_1173 [Edaphobacter sp.]|nr:hypothetical protein [Edaphobacter sp.]